MEGTGGIGSGSGALLKAKVLGNTARGAIVLVKGKPLTVQGGVQLSEGKEVNGKIVTSKAGLRFEVRQELPVLDRSVTSGKAHLGTFLKNHGVAPNEMNLLAGHKAMQMGQALTPELFTQLQKYSSLLPEVTEKNIHSLLFMLANGLPMHKRVFGLTRDHLDGKSSLKRLIKGVFGFSKFSGSSLKSYLPQLSEKGFDLKRFFSRSGINSESKLAQMQVLEDDFLSELQRQGRQKSLRAIKDLFSFSKIFSQGEKGDSEQVFTIPYLVDDEVEEMVVRFRKESKSQKKGEQYGSLDLYLELSRLGPLMLSFSMVRDSISLVIRSPHQETVDDLGQSLMEFQTELESIEGVTHSRVRILREGVSAPSEQVEETSAAPVKVDIKA